MSDLSVPFTETRRSFDEPKPAWGIDRGDGAIFIRCGGCGKCIDLHESHTIAADGTVRPSVYHDEADCGWHVFIKLEEWGARGVL